MNSGSGNGTDQAFSTSPQIDIGSLSSQIASICSGFLGGIKWIDRSWCSATITAPPSSEWERRGVVGARLVGKILKQRLAILEASAQWEDRKPQLWSFGTRSVPRL